MRQDDVEALATEWQQRIVDGVEPEANSIGGGVGTGGGLVAVDLVAVDRETLAMQIFHSESDLTRVSEQ